MTAFDVFNGDADGVLALHQWRLAYPLDATLVTGVKRDISLLARVPAEAVKHVAVFDISLDANRAALQRLLAAQVRVVYFDHHHAGTIPQHHCLSAHIDTSPETCTSLLVDQALSGRFRLWAIAAAFGDNALVSARLLAREQGLSAGQIELLQMLGTCLNYNGYGDALTDLHFHPAELYAELHPYADPFAFIAECAAFSQLERGMAADRDRAASVSPHAVSNDAALYLLPDARWTRRISGVFANDLAQSHPQRAHAVLTPNAQGNYTVSVRAPLAFPQGADMLCRYFTTGGGRTKAAGINQLPAGALNDFQARFLEHFDARRRNRIAGEWFEKSENVSAR